MNGCSENVVVSRRSLLGGAASLALWGLTPRPASAAASRDPRLLTIILRGGLDGLALASPAGDPHLLGLRGKIAVTTSGEAPGLPLDGTFVLNPAMPFLHGLYEKGEAAIIHAVASPYRQRSHFDGQDVLESGLGGVGRVETGWLNRALVELGKAADSGKANTAGLSKVAPKGLAMGAVVPLVMRGAAPVLSWIPQTFNMPLRELTIARLMDLYAATDPGLAKAFAEGIALDKVAVSTGTSSTPGVPSQVAFKPFIETAEAAARFLGSADGPRIGCLSYDGWDTHANEGALKGQLANRLGGLDAALRAFAEKIGPAWKDTAVVVVTEFGRTVRINGTDGTDHGTATVALVLGGAVRGKRVIGDWPGLSEKALHEGRDLKPTRDLRTVLKGVLRDHVGMTDKTLDDAVFPGSAGVTALGGLVS